MSAKLTKAGLPMDIQKGCTVSVNEPNYSTIYYPCHSKILNDFAYTVRLMFQNIHYIINIHNSLKGIHMCINKQTTCDILLARPRKVD